ncbi:MAG: DUF4178 domain-containing protein [Burkholderiaceae bacterium]|nr:DUF4178 domain-containing protein [Burkholderiaceae bacterium]
MASSPTQRHYRAPCPGCGAPVEFRSAQSTHAVCAYCHSTVVRHGEVLERIGKMAELFDDHSPLQLLATGRAALDGAPQPFTLIGRLQYKGPAGTWTEWNAAFDDGRQATLGEDNGAYVLSQPVTVAGGPLGDPAASGGPDLAQLHLGQTLTVAGKSYSVAAHLQACLIAAEGELPRLPALGALFTVVELRSADGEVLSIDAGQQPPQWARGRAVALEDLQLQGLKEASVKEEKSRQFSCPHCGAPVQVQLDRSQSVTCPACHSLIDLRSGIGGALRHALQDEPVQPLIPLGSTGRLQGVDWQVVGFQHRMGVSPGDDEHFGWSEYLLYHRQQGFAFLVDAEDGWSLVRPTTGAPALSRDGQSATYLGTRYTLQYSYQAETDFVLGEFYWPVERGQTTRNRDFASAKGLLSREETPGEVTWSSGDRLRSDAVAQAFPLPEDKNRLQRDDPGPFVAASGVGMATVVLIVVALIVLVIVLSQLSGTSGGGLRSSSGSYGGYSSGGSHK